MGAEHARRLRTNSAAYSEHAYSYSQKPDDRAWLRPLVSRFAGAVGAGGRVIDLGCGPGRETVELQAAGLRVVGLDATRRFLEIGRREHPCSGYVQADFTALPLHSGALDGVWAASSLLHLAREDAPRALLEVHRALRAGGMFYSSMQIGDAEGVIGARPHDAVQAERFYAFWQPEGWRQALETAGFAVAAVDTFEFDDETAYTGCNIGGRGWINAWARKP